MTDHYFNAPLAEVDPEIAQVLERELERQRGYLEMIASENFVPVSVLQSQGSVLTNKYAEGYPGRRYYGGCEEVDVAEELAIERAKSLFGADFANVQPHSGATANAAVLHAIARPGDTLLGLSLDQGGHLTHGMKINFSGRLFNIVAYGVDPETSVIDMDEVRRLAIEHQPKVIIAGWSAYPRQLDFAAFREIADEVGALLWVDMAHFAGLVAAGLHPNPVPHAHVVSSTVHKTIGGPRSGFILTNDADIAKKINTAVFPGQQGGPLMHVIAAKATAFKLAATPEFKERQERVLSGAHIIAERLSQQDVKDAGIAVRSGGTDVHLVLVDLRDAEIDGKQAEDLLHEIHITVNRNAVPNDPRPPMVTSGLRIGTPALATRGFGDAEFHRGRRHHRARAAAGCRRRGSPRPRRRADRRVPAVPRPRAVAVGRQVALTDTYVHSYLSRLSRREGRSHGRTRPRRDDSTQTRPGGEDDDGTEARRGAAAAAIKEELRERVAALAERGIVPGIATVLVGADPASQLYVGMKHRQSEAIGMNSIQRELPADATQAAGRGSSSTSSTPTPRATATSCSCRCRSTSTPTRSSSASTPPRMPTACTRPTSGASCSTSTPDHLAAAVHAARRHRAAAAQRLRPEGQARGRRRPRRHDRPLDRPAADPPRVQRDCHADPHRHGRPVGITCGRPTSSSRRRA